MMLISPEYRDLQYDLHQRFDYGRGVDAAECASIIRSVADEHDSVLDYGCGQGHLARLLDGYAVGEYDPCVPGKDVPPLPADYVVCADVLEHIEPDCLDAVLTHIKALTRRAAVFVIATQPSKKIMADGRSAHLIVESAQWWAAKISKYMEPVLFSDRSHSGGGVLMICHAKAPQANA